MLLSMDLLYLYIRTKVNYHEKDSECFNDDGQKIMLQGKKNTTSVRMVTTMQENQIVGNGVYYSQFTFLVIKVRMLRLQNS